MMESGNVVNTGDGLIDQILKERGNRYGEFTDNSQIAQKLKDVIYMWTLANEDNFLDSHHLEAIHMIFSKISRIVTGDPNYADNWLDIAGYAELVARECDHG